MKQFTYTIKDELGVHARPAGLLVKLAKKYASKVTIEKDGKTCDMRKLMAVMGLGIKQGETITVTVEGDDKTARNDRRRSFRAVFLCYAIKKGSNTPVDSSDSRHYNRSMAKFVEEQERKKYGS